MLVMNKQGMENLLASKFKLGADASVAAGPVGRHADASTDWKMRAEVLTYSRARGIFAGISLNGAVITQHEDDTREFYGRIVPFRSILLGQVGSPKDAAPWRETLTEYAGGAPASRKQRSRRRRQRRHRRQPRPKARQDSRRSAFVAANVERRAAHPNSGCALR